MGPLSALFALDAGQNALKLSGFQNEGIPDGANVSFPAA
jgi:hypothetical protein